MPKLTKAINSKCVTWTATVGALLLLSGLLLYKTIDICPSSSDSYKILPNAITPSPTRDVGSSGGSIPVKRIDWSLAGSVGTISPPALPSIRISGAEEVRAQKIRKFYGGKGDKLHLGGFKGYDRMGVSNNTWNYMMGPLGIKSVLDMGCGRGISTSYFLERGANVLCVEGSHDAVLQSLLPHRYIVEHDFTRGPWWPAETFDAMWSVEFLEHVSRQFMRNYLPSMRRSALLFLTASNNGGWHHVEIHESWWWRARMHSYGFVYSEELTVRVRNAAKATCVDAWGLRIVNRMMVFINPSIASLPQHDHLFAGNGCIFDEQKDVPCDDRYKWATEIDRLPAHYESLLKCQFHPTNSKEDPPPPALGVWDCEKNERAQE